jgi:branched-chain amino acid transport system permease protein
MIFFGMDIGLLLTDLIAILAVYAIVSMSLNLQFGYAGIPNFGLVLFVSAGAAFAGAISGRLIAWILGVGAGQDFIVNNSAIMQQVNGTLQSNLPLSIAVLVLALCIAGAAGGLFGFVASFPAIRLREDYLAIFLYVMGAFFQIFMINYQPLVGGTLAIQLPDVYAWAGNLRFVLSTGVMVLFAILVFVYVQRIAKSPLGRLLRATRENEVAAGSYGKKVLPLRRNVLIVGCAIAGIGGALYSFNTLSVQAQTFNAAQWTFWPFVMVIMGGMSNNVGTIVGVGAFWAVLKGADYSKYYFLSFLPFNITWVEYLILSLILLAILIYRPEGLIREKPSDTLGSLTQRILRRVRGPPKDETR